MSTFNTGQQQNVIYQADPAVIRHLHGVRDSLHQSCKPYLNHKVNVQTIDGFVHEGVIAGVDNKHLYLNVAANGQMPRGFTTLISRIILIRARDLAHIQDLIQVPHTIIM